MALKSINPTQTAAWKRLLALRDDALECDMKEMFKSDPNRAIQFAIEWESFFVDYSKNYINKQVMQELMALAHEVKLADAIMKYFSGDAINQTENRAVLHTALRSNSKQPLIVDGQDVRPDIAAVKFKIKSFCNNIHSGIHRGYTNKPFTDIVNIGIGGSDLGPAMAVEALSFYGKALKLHFVSNVDGDHVQEILKKINPETTLFVVVSKTFTTQETLTNAETIRNWFLKSATAQDVAKHFVAVSTNLERVGQFGIAEENVFPMWDWVGGRFSLWSAVGLSVALAIGHENFEQMLAGAAAMDNHFSETPFEKNIPVVLALLSVWYNNFYHAESHAVIPYTQYLSRLAAYLQQGIMESNGKGTDRAGKKVNYQTGNIIWGEPGTNAQHAFFQLLHQGTKLIPADFIAFAKPLHGDSDHHDKLMSNFFAQTEALLMGKEEEKVCEELQKLGKNETEIDYLKTFKTFSGNRPTNTILIEELTPYTFGALLAMYESKIFVEGVVWNIFSFDQWGVELGKQLANNILLDFQSQATLSHDASTLQLIERYKKVRRPE